MDSPSSPVSDIEPDMFIDTPPTTLASSMSDEASAVNQEVAAPAHIAPDHGNLPWFELPLAVPWPDGIFIIVERATQRALAAVPASSTGALTLQPTLDVEARSWFCVESRGYFGFQNLLTGRFLGATRRVNGLIAEAANHGIFEYFIPRSHPNGGYELLNPGYTEIWAVDRVEGTDGFTVRLRGSTTWDFYKLI